MKDGEKPMSEEESHQERQRLMKERREKLMQEAIQK